MQDMILYDIIHTNSDSAHTLFTVVEEPEPEHLSLQNCCSEKKNVSDCIASCGLQTVMNSVQPSVALNPAVIEV